jgi:hypothetical protein
MDDPDHSVYQQTGLSINAACDNRIDSCWPVLVRWNGTVARMPLLSMVGSNIFRGDQHLNEIIS